jgi:hypothetical protein
MVCKLTMKWIFSAYCLLIASAASASLSSPEGFFAQGELLAWQLREGSDENWAQDIPPKSAEQSITLYDAPFEWKPGFRLGFGYQAPNHHWDTALYYTDYRTQASNKAAGDITSAYLGNFFANNTNGSDFGPFYDTAKIKWHFAFQSLDFELGRVFNFDNVLRLRPFVGLKAALITQDIDSDWFGPKTVDAFGNIIRITTFSSASEKIENNFWGIGPVLGLNSTWPLYQKENHSLSIVGNASGALMWGRWTFSDQYQNNTPLTVDVDTGDLTDAATMVRGVLGLEWSEKMKDTVLGISLTYESQIWFDQVQYYDLNMGKLDNLMSLQGGNLAVKLIY